MSSFAALMALSATQTRQSEAAVQSALVERQRKEAQKRKEQEEKERKEREIERKLRLKRFEEEKREQERQRRLEQEREAKERELRRQQEEERDKLRYGPKKAAQKTDSKGYPVSRAGSHKRSSSASDDESSAANALTREEKRKRRQEAEMRVANHSVRRTTHTSGYNKAGRRLPGGAVDITTTSLSLSDPSGSMSVRQRLLAEPAMLIKLNVNKRDTRTIDEIVQDRARAKAALVLQGDQAREFSDWFGKGKAKEAAAKKAASQTDSASTSRANTPATGSQPASKLLSGSASPATRPSGASRPTSSASFAKPATGGRPGAPKATPAKAAVSFSSKPSATATKVLPSSKLGASASKPNMKKRPRSPSPSVSPVPPSKKRATSSGPRHDDISQEIWKLFGKDRSRYVAADVMSDDEDMEAGARDLEYEELRSSRIARREEELALEEERRHEEEKRRRRKEKEMRERRGQ